MFSSVRCGSSYSALSVVAGRIWNCSKFEASVKPALVLRRHLLNYLLIFELCHLNHGNGECMLLLLNTLAEWYLKRSYIPEFEHANG